MVIIWPQNQQAVPMWLFTIKNGDLIKWSSKRRCLRTLYQAILEPRFLYYQHFSIMSTREQYYLPSACFLCARIFLAILLWLKSKNCNKPPMRPAVLPNCVHFLVTAVSSNSTPSKSRKTSFFLSPNVVTNFSTLQRIKSTSYHLKSIKKLQKTHLQKLWFIDYHIKLIKEFSWQ